MRPPVMFWFTVDNPPMTEPITIRVIRGADGRGCLTLEQADTVVSVVLDRDEIRQLRGMLAHAPH